MERNNVVAEKEVTAKELKEWVQIIREQNQKEWKEVEELLKISAELDVRRYELSGSTTRPVSIPYCTSAG